jgi:hypothetical protein
MLRAVEQSPLRPAPLAPPGPVDPADAQAQVAALLPRLHETPARALALILLSGRSRAEAAAAMGLSADELADALATGRNRLRRSVRALEGSGWCLRAERHLSDRLDGALAGNGAAVLDAHLANCPRCAEHERRLVQAQNALVAGLGRQPSEDIPPAALSVVTEQAPAPPAEEGLPALVTATVAVLLTMAAALLLAAIALAVGAIV